MTLGAGDVLTLPKGLQRRLVNAAPGAMLAYGTRGGDSPAAPQWAADIGAGDAYLWDAGRRQPGRAAVGGMTFGRTRLAYGKRGGDSPPASQRAV